MEVPEIRYARSVGDVDIAYSEFGREDGPRLVFVSRTVRDLVVGSELRFEDRGTYELKGVPDSWQLYAAVS